MTTATEFGATEFGVTEFGATAAMPAIPLSRAAADGELARRLLARRDRELAAATRRLAAREAALEVLRCDPPATRAAGGDEGGLVANVRRWIGATEADAVAEQVRRSALFLPGWYAHRHRDRIGGGDPFAHFVAEGLAAGLMPNPFFDPAWYAATHRFDAAREPALLHYIRLGAAYALAPGPLFDPADYLSRYPQAIGAPDLLAHLLREGLDAGLLPEPVAA